MPPPRPLFQSASRESPVMMAFRCPSMTLTFRTRAPRSVSHSPAAWLVKTTATRETSTARRLRAAPSGIEANPQCTLEAVSNGGPLA